jgi:deoxycytidylate deaminase
MLTLQRERDHSNPEHTNVLAGSVRSISYRGFAYNRYGESHAEIEAISRGFITEGDIVVVTTIPCEACAKALVGADVGQIYIMLPSRMKQEWWLDQMSGLKHLDEWRIPYTILGEANFE